MSKASEYVEKHRDAEKVRPVFPFKPSIADTEQGCEIRAELNHDGGIRIFKLGELDSGGVRDIIEFTMTYKEALKLSEWIIRIFQDE